jgi:uncharacterized hydantoinase/oxoprolinase family protein
MEKIKLIKNAPLEVGDQVMCVRMKDDYSAVPTGVKGIVKKVSEVFGVKQYYVDWKNGSKLALIEGEDQWRKITSGSGSDEENLSESKIVLVRTKSDILRNNMFNKKSRI